MALKVEMRVHKSGKDKLLEVLSRRDGWLIEKTYTKGESTKVTAYLVSSDPPKVPSRPAT